MKSEKFLAQLVRHVRQVGLVFLTLTLAPLAAAIALRSRSAGSDYTPEWWAVLAVLAVSVALISLLRLFGRRSCGDSLARAAVLSVGAAVAYEAVMGLCQIAGLVPSAHSTFVLTGSFYNPGPYGGFIALGLPIGLSLSFSRERLPRWSGLALVLLILTVLPASASRSAWVAAALSCGFVAICHRREAVGRWLRRWWPLLAVLLLSAALGAYLLKPDSADGRMLMWRIGLKACAAHPRGVGWHNVAGTYGDAQEAYFAAGGATAGEIAVAGAPEYLFNEYLQVALAWGCPAALAFVAVLAAAVLAAVRLRLYGAAGAVLAFAVFAFSSYPLQFPLFVAAMGVLIIGVAASACRSRLSRSLLAVIGLAAAALIGVEAAAHHRKADTYRRWQPSRILYRSGRHAPAVTAMQAFGDSLEWNPNFMFELGHSLHNIGAYDESNRVLARAARVSADPMIYNVRGKNYQALTLRDSALTELRRAADRLPNRMYPHYLMVLLAAGSDPVDTALLRREARIVLHMPVKVMSPAVREMRDSTLRIKQRAESEAPTS